MTVPLFFQLLINAIALGLLYMLVVLGLDVILRVTGLVNFAHGQIYMLGGYAIFYSQAMLHINFALGLIFSGVVVGFIGCVCYYLIFNRVQRRFKPGDLFVYMMVMSAMGSLGLMMIMSQGALLLFGTEPKSVQSPFSELLHVGNVIIPGTKLVVIGASLLIMALLWVLMYKTKLGLSMRAVSSDSEVASSHGINAFRTYLVGFGLGCGLAGLAGGIIAPVFSVSTGMGQSMIFLALIVQLMGGIGSYLGTVVAAFIVGIVLSFGQFLIGGLAQLALFGFMIVLLIFRPGGLFGEALD